MSYEHKPIMKKSWALDHSEYLGYFYLEDPKGKCNVPSCPNSRRKVLIHRHIVRSPTSGDVAEIGWICHGNWCVYHGEPVDPEFLAYLENAERAHNASKKGIRVIGTFEKWLSKWGKENPGKKMPANEVRQLREEAKEANRIEELKRQGKLHRYDYPVSKFKNLKEARKWAKKRDGYVPLPNPITIRDEEKWMVYVSLE